MKPARVDVSLLKREGEFAISKTAGKKPISVRTLAGWPHAILGDAIDGFQLKRIRSGVETLLAARGVSREVPGHLQSHGLTGVQARHYDGHDYVAEKSSALDILCLELRTKGRRVGRRRVPAAGQLSLATGSFLASCPIAVTAEAPAASSPKKGPAEVGTRRQRTL